MEKLCAGNVKEVGRSSRRRSAITSPCRSCVRVKDPSACEDKNCAVWQRWFADSWNDIRAYPRRQMERTAPMGICVGGWRYAHPDQLRAYLKNDPCAVCGCPRELCAYPCRAKTVWNEAIKEAKI